MATISLHSSYSLTTAPPLNTCTVQQPRAALSRLHMLLHASAVSALLYHRLSTLLRGSAPHLLPWGLIALAELIFAAVWALAQAFRLRPVARAAAPENLPSDENLPGVDVFVCTADPKKEPVAEVMNTVVSAMAMDYPAEKLAVYLSDDGGAAATRYAMKEACAFAESWVPFCREYGIKTRCPEAFFSSLGEDEREALESDEFNAQVDKIERSQNDIYDGQARAAYKTKYQGMDGLGGTVCAGTGYYIRKKALFSNCNQQDESLQEPEHNFGLSRKFIDSVKALDTKYEIFPKHVNTNVNISDSIVEEANKLASCSYEHNTKWGKEIGYSYDCLLESTFTGYLMHSRGWKSVYLYPDRPCFLGCTTIDMKDALVQLMKWASGLVQVGLSRFSPLTYGVSRMPLPQALCYGFFAFSHFISVACFLYGTVAPICFFYGIPLFPKVTSPWFAVFAGVYASSAAQHFYEVNSSGGTVRTMWNEQRIWIIRAVTACLFGCVDVLMKYAGVAKANFRLTNKVVDQEKLDKYQQGKFDFQGAKMFMVPLTLLVLLNLGCFVGGAKGLVSQGNVAEMLGQGLLSMYVLVLSFPILQGLVPRLGK
ncbi:hypothetical protein SASPL_145845 [Salvia splendens]|uniref:Cellulose synthase A n=1 Tax=Salvia splendens TaxID=180675 RepID=A0A8X8Z8Q5_SALSN|nr:hypothetical protein SASPL_145845 [Salvia splendens]